MRTFIAVDFPKEVVNKINEIITYFKAQVPDSALKWVPAENLHLTVRFIGEINSEQLAIISPLLIEAMRDISSFNIGIEGLGMYPKPANPRVIWLGINDGFPLKTIHQNLNHVLKAINVQPEAREFSPHLTIARLKRQTDPEVVKQIGKILSQHKVGFLGHVSVNHLTLYQSSLTPSGPDYKALLTLNLNQV